LLVPAINWMIFKLRFLWFVHVRRNLKEYADGQSVIAQEYSKQMLIKGITSNRPLSLIRPLSVIDRVRENCGQMEVLSVGSRYETELLYLKGHGFRNVRGLDMLSYSPLIDCGNMHALPYADDRFDALVMGWVIAYSDDPKKAVEEAVRVTKSGGYIAIGLSSYSERFVENRLQAGGGIIGDYKKRIQTTDGLLALFGDAVDKIYFRHDREEVIDSGTCLLVVSISKAS
jgi:SAM-dependent methyltransferase